MFVNSSNKYLKIFFIVLLFSLIFTCISFAKEVNITASSNVTKNDLESITLDLFKEYVAEIAPEVNVDVHYVAELGGEREVFEAMQLGMIQMSSITTGVVGAFYPEIGVLSLCYLYPNLEVAKEIAKSDIAKKLAEQCLEKTGIRVLGFVPKSFRVTISKKPLKNINDLKGFKIRLPKDPVLIDAFKQLGAKPTPIPWGDVYTSLKTGMVDGMESTPSAIYAMKFWETTDYMTITNHQLLWYGLWISDSFYQSLSKEVQIAINIAAEKAINESIDKAKDIAETNLEKLKLVQKEVYYPDLRTFMEAVQPTYDAFEKKTNSIGIIDEIKKVIGAE